MNNICESMSIKYNTEINYNKSHIQQKKRTLYKTEI